MRVRVVTCWFPSRVNPGSGSFVATDAAALSRVHDVGVVHLVAPALDDGVRRDVAGGVPVIRFPMSTTSPSSIARAAVALRPLLRDADVVHTMAFPSLLPLRLLAPAAPAVHTEHWSGIPRMGTGRFGSAKRRIAGAIYRVPDVVAAVSEYLARAVAGVSGRGVEVIPNIVQSPGLRPRRCPDGSIRLLSIGALKAVKDPGLALATLAELRRRGHDARLTWVGDGPLAAGVADDAERLGVRAAVTLTGALPREAIRDQLDRADVLLHTSTIETFSLVAAEALGAGRPVVIQSEGGHTDFVRPPFGRLVRERTPEAFADGVEAAVAAAANADPAEISAEITSRFSEDAFVERWTEVYERVAR
ncbi:MAG TPA: glycosyltransferase [Actinomycetaceae bacterium]|nr:glycosyltransferase [Actinomycetaceae bacterium]